MTTATPSLKHGHVVAWEQETSLGSSTPTASTALRHEEGLAFPTETRQVAAQSNLGHAVAFDKPDQPIIYEAVRESALKLPVMIRRASADDATPPIVELFQAGGCAVSSLSDKTTATYTDASNLTLAADVIDGAAGSDTGGHAVLLEEDGAGIYVPALVGAYTAATKDVALAVALPAQPSDGSDVQQMYTITPRVRQVPSDKTLGFRVYTRGKSSSAPDLAFDLKGCALASLDGITLEPGQDVPLTFNFHVADVAKATAALTAETLKDGASYQRIGGSFECILRESAAPPVNLALTRVEMVKADINLGISTVPIPGEGSSNCINSIQGYQAVYEQATVDLQLLMDVQYWTEIEKADQADRKVWFLGFVQPTSDLDIPAWGLWFPRMHIIDVVSADLQGADYMLCTLKMGATSAEFGASERDNDDPEMAPWYFAVSNEES